MKGSIYEGLVVRGWDLSLRPGLATAALATWLLRSRRDDVAATDFPTPKEPVVDLAAAAGDRGWLGARRAGRVA